MSQTDFSESIESLAHLGFTELEAAAYAFLVGNSPATAYRVAQETGKPVANTYKAVQSLFNKGAIMIDETENRLCQAVEPEVFLGNLESSYLAHQNSAKKALSKLNRSKDNERVYSLSTTEQVFDKCRKMCEEADSILLVDAFPGVVEILRPWLEEASERGVKVVIQIYEEFKIEEVETILMLNAKQMLDRWRGEWLIVVADGAEYLQAFLNEDLRDVRVANWCGSAFLALPQHNFLANTFRQARIEEKIRMGSSVSELQDEIERTNGWTTMAKRGYDSLRERFGNGNID